MLLGSKKLVNLTRTGSIYNKKGSNFISASCGLSQYFTVPSTGTVALDKKLIPNLSWNTECKFFFFYDVKNLKKVFDLNSLASRNPPCRPAEFS
jgi:hypothetical protein